MYTVISNCPYADQALPFPEAEPNPVYASVSDTGIEPYTDNHLDQPDANFWLDTVRGRIADKRQDATP